VERPDGIAIRLCGRLEVAPDGRDVSERLPGRQGRLIVAYLAAERGRPITRDELIDLLWPSDPPARPGEVLDSLLSKLRRAVGAGVIEGRRELSLVLPEGAWVDLEIATEAIKRAEASLAVGDAKLALADATLACELTAGGFLPGLDNRWVVERRLEVEELRLSALNWVGEAGLAVGGGGLGVGERAARELISASPLSELGYRLLMEILAARGDTAAALGVFDRLRVRLRDELGIAPGSAVRAVQARMLAVRDRSEPPMGDSPQSQPVSPREERKLVTVFAAEPQDDDAPGDPEEHRLAGSRFGELVRDEVERFGGIVRGSGGVGVLALFGATVAHEDDTERAVRAALRLREDGVAGRVGISTGEVLVLPGSLAADATGRPIEDAVRLRHAAPPGAVLADGATVHATPPDAVAYDVLAEGTWVVRGVSERGTAAFERPLGSRFVGRENEVALLDSHYKRVAEREHASLVVIVGQAGVGKSRLVDEFLAHLEPLGPSVYRGRCLAYGEGTTYWALREVLYAAARIALDDTAAIAARKLRARVASTVEPSDIDRVTAALAMTAGIAMRENPLERLAPASVADELALAWPAFLGGLAGQAPAIVVIEDLHWAEPPLLDMVERLATRSTGPLLLIVTARPELAEARRGWSTRPGVSQVALEPLAETASRELVSELLPFAEAGMRERMLAIAEGNPFFAEELARHVSANPADPAGIPHTVRAVLAARIDGLPDAEKQVLRDAAVVGRTFWATTLQAIEPRGDLPESLRILEDRGLVIARPTSALPGQIELSFRHGLTREVAYRSIPRARRCRAHAAVGRWVEQLAGDRRDELIELIAYHYERAGRPEDAALAWPDDPERRDALVTQAVKALIDAGEGARRQSSLGAALGFARRAHRLARDERERLAALELEARTHHAAARPDDALAAYRAAIEVAGKLGDDEKALLLQAYAALATVRYYGAPHSGWEERGIDLIEQLIADDRIPRGTFAHAAALIGRAGLRERLGRDARSLEEAKRDAEQAVAIAESIGSPELLATSLEGLTWTVFEEGFCDMAAIGDRLLAATVTSPDRFEAYESVVIAAMCHCWAGDFTRAAQLTHEAGERAQGLSPHRALHSAAASAVCLVPQGRFAEVGRLTCGVIELVREEGDRTCNQAIVGLAGRLLWLFETQDPALAEGLELLREIRPLGASMGPKTGASTAETLRPIVGAAATLARLVPLDAGADRGDAILRLRAELPALAVSNCRDGLDAAIAHGRELSRSACAPALGWIADWAEAVQMAGDDPALALRRARRATTALARHGERYTAARLLCDLLPLIHTDLSAEVASATATELEAMGALASARQAASAVTPS
jgi:DNA-binding SARP family transcriptional activator/tetratricopeptide (TPR) repeat protein